MFGSQKLFLEKNIVKRNYFLKIGCPMTNMNATFGSQKVQRKIK